MHRACHARRQDSALMRMSTFRPFKRAAGGPRPSPSRHPASSPTSANFLPGGRGTKRCAARRNHGPELDTRRRKCAREQDLQDPDMATEDLSASPMPDTRALRPYPARVTNLSVSAPVEELLNTLELHSSEAVTVPEGPPTIVGMRGSCIDTTDAVAWEGIQELHL